MHLNNFEVFHFINSFELNYISKLDKKINLIYRNYEKPINFKLLIDLRNYCKSNNIKLYFSNNIKIAKKYNLDGVYIPSFNKKMIVSNKNLKKNFKILGSAHNIKEIRQKEMQNVEYIFYSPIFKNKGNNKKVYIYNLSKIIKLSNSKIVALGGINNNNIKKLKLVNCKRFAYISNIIN
tara:strand:+ start:1747 stop:2283 length:537 start_codon:yes stop_codon:yes gene_type:complete